MELLGVVVGVVEGTGVGLGLTFGLAGLLSGGFPKTASGLVQEMRSSGT